MKNKFLVKFFDPEDGKTHEQIVEAKTRKTVLEAFLSNCKQVLSCVLL